MIHFDTTASRYRQLGLWLLATGLLCLALADLAVITHSPWQELARLASGFISPDLSASDAVWRALGLTLSFALQGVGLAVLVGSLLSLCWHWRWVRALCAVLRSIHELFWGLMFLQLFGLSALTGVLAIAVPYSGIIAKVFGEMLEESDRRPARAAPGDSDALSLFLFARLPMVWRGLCQYSAYRLECGIRSSAILGFIGLPTLGFQMESAFRQGDYGAGSALLYLLLLVIATQRWWLRARLLPVYLLLALVLSPPVSSGAGADMAGFLQQLTPAPLRDGEGWGALLSWLSALWHSQGASAIWQTLVLGTAALLGSFVLALLLVPLVSPHFGNRASRAGSHLLLVLMRSTPEFLIAFVLLLILGPSMLPGILALALHTGAIIAFLCARLSTQVRLRDDAPRGLSRYTWELLPRLFPNFLALSLYRWEIFMRETAILGILGIQTLGFYVDSAFAEFRLDRALALILMGVALNLMVDALSRRIRARLRLQHTAIVLERPQ